MFSIVENIYKLSVTGYTLLLILRSQSVSYKSTTMKKTLSILECVCRIDTLTSYILDG